MKMQPSELAHRPRQVDRRSALLDALRAAAGPMRVAELAAAVGVAEPTAQFHLSMLVSSGQVARTRARSGLAGRPSWRYSAAPETSPALPYEQLARLLAAQIDAGAGSAEVAREAGRRWAEAIPDGSLSPAADHDGAVAALTGVLDGLGFRPDVRRSGAEVVLRACPFVAVAREHRGVVCGVHLGLLDRAVAAIGGGLAVDGLEPFTSDEPLACLVRLSATA